MEFTDGLIYTVTWDRPLARLQKHDQSFYFVIERISVVFAAGSDAQHGEVSGCAETPLTAVIVNSVGPPLGGPTLFRTHQTHVM
jgi:hypothetical protein